jgi:plasmid maintenance system antidote protein VapI
MSLPDTKRLTFRKFTKDDANMTICMAIRLESDINSELKCWLKNAHHKA